MKDFGNTLKIFQKYLSMNATMKGFFEGFLNSLRNVLMNEIFEKLTNNGIFQRPFRNITEKVSAKKSQKYFTESFLKYSSHISKKVF